MVRSHTQQKVEHAPRTKRRHHPPDDRGRDPLDERGPGQVADRELEEDLPVVARVDGSCEQRRRELRGVPHS